MSGYTPLFDSMLDGTLFGRWPHTGVWACLLSQVSREGVIDMRPELLAAKIGCPLAELIRCIEDFMQPDHESRTVDNDGRRLELIDGNRSWGWRVLNHGKYREKARKKAFDAERTSTGADAARKRTERGESREVPSRPVVSRDLPLSSPTPSPTPEADKKVPTEPVPLRVTGSAEPDPVETVFTHWQETHRKPRAKLDDKRRALIRKALKHYSAADLCQAITGYLNSPHHMGTNPNGTVYDSVELFLRDSQHIDAGLKFYAEPPRTDLSATTRRNVAAIADWQPPELRNNAGN